MRQVNSCAYIQPGINLGLCRYCSKCPGALPRNPSLPIRCPGGKNGGGKDLPKIVTLNDLPKKFLSYSGALNFRKIVTSKEVPQLLYGGPLCGKGPVPWNMLTMPKYTTAFSMLDGECMLTGKVERACCHPSNIKNAYTAYSTHLNLIWICETLNSISMISTHALHSTMNKIICHFI